MKILTISEWHDSNSSTYDTDTNEFRYYKEERLSNKKHSDNHSMIIERIGDFDPDVIALVIGLSFKPIAVTDLFGIFSEKDVCGQRWQSAQINSTIKSLHDYPKYTELLKANKVYWVHHDYAHILSSWIMGVDYPDYGISIDGGAFVDGNNKLIISNPFDLNSGRILLKDHRNPLGFAYQDVAELLGITGLKNDMAGKLMGLQSYGTFDKTIFKTPTKQLRTCLRDVANDKVLKFQNLPIKNTKLLNFIATFHKRWKDCVLSYFDEFIPDNSSVVFGGGCAQNTVTNWELYKKYNDITFIPQCYDGGLSIGAMGLMMLLNNIEFPKIPNYPYIQEDEAPTTTASDKTIKTLAKLLADGKIVGWYQGHGECGPRALGHRSILMNPAIPNGKDIINSRVKHREWWRPFAPSVMAEHAHEWFDIDKNKSSKYMMIAIPANPDKADIIPSVVHEDGSSRIQTVNLSDDESFYNLLSEFYKLTGIPLLLNTSLNAGGSPIMGDPQQAKDILKNVDIDAMCIGDKIIYK